MKTKKIACAMTFERFSSPTWMYHFLRGERGITLIELILALALATLLLTSATQAYLMSQKIWEKQDRLTEGIYNLYVPMSIIERDARRAQELRILTDTPDFKRFDVIVPTLDGSGPQTIMYFYSKNTAQGSLFRNTSVIADKIGLSIKKEQGKGVYDNQILQSAGLAGIDPADLNLSMDMYYIFTFTDEDPSSPDFSKSVSMAVSPRNWFNK